MTGWIKKATKEKIEVNKNEEWKLSSSFKNWNNTTYKQHSYNKKKCKRMENSWNSSKDLMGLLIVTSTLETGF